MSLVNSGNRLIFSDRPIGIDDGRDRCRYQHAFINRVSATPDN